MPDFVDVPLFDVPDDAWVIPPPTEELTRGERAKRRIAARIASGVHPLGKGIRLHDDAFRDPENRVDGLRCGFCRYREIHGWPKCMLPVKVGDKVTYPRNTGAESSDVRAWWPACTDYEEKP